ncbi:hypothetical protein EK21DRAFT_83535 [Setomelanomma holmii]|uniref:RING-type domain-containing protein n=1 Tax=Setomelanomma holmii TaxID=210430 RepID=A0A9P4HJW1_9PLEO|nr:hypothetical protein EK21DRAFT_83535 [Setomelanomma holmii]
MMHTRPPCPTCTRVPATRRITPADNCPPTCTICLEPFATASSPNNQLSNPSSEPAIAITKCGHTFGQNCLAQWMRDSNTCPICRVEFFDLPKQPMEEDERPLFALGVYVEPNVLQHFSGLVISERSEDGNGFAAYEQGRGNEKNGGTEENGRSEGRSGRRRVYYA